MPAPVFYCMLFGDVLVPLESNGEKLYRASVINAHHDCSIKRIWNTVTGFLKFKGHRAMPQVVEHYLTDTVIYAVTYTALYVLYILYVHTHQHGVHFLKLG